MTATSKFEDSINFVTGLAVYCKIRHKCSYICQNMKMSYPSFDWMGQEECVSVWGVCKFWRFFPYMTASSMSAPAHGFVLPIFCLHSSSCNSNNCLNVRLLQLLNFSINIFLPINFGGTLHAPDCVKQSVCKVKITGISEFQSILRPLGWAILCCFVSIDVT